MSGPLVTLVNDHGPTDHAEWAVLSVVAERVHGPTRTWDSTTAGVAKLARVSPDTAKRAIARLDAGGWIHRVPGRWKGNASTYRLRLEAFPADAVEEALQACTKGGTVHPSLFPQGGTEHPLEGQRGAQSVVKGGTMHQHSVSVRTPSNPTRDDEPAPGVLASVRIGPDERYTRRALETFGIVASEPMKRRLGQLEAAGWTAARVNAHLLDNIDASNCRDLAKVVGGQLRDLSELVSKKPAPAPPAPPAVRAEPEPEPEPEHEREPLDLDSLLAEARGQIDAARGGAGLYGNRPADDNRAAELARLQSKSPRPAYDAVMRKSAG